MRIGSLDINVKFLLPAIGYMTFIFYLSSLPGSVSGKDTDVSRFIYNFLHIPLFGILSVLLLCALKGYTGPFEITKKTYFVSFCLTVLYAFFDEWRQTFSRDRMFSLFDIFLDGIGGAAFLGLFALLRKRFNDRSISKRSYEKKMGGYD
jgi:VanZ family protein